MLTRTHTRKHNVLFTLTELTNICQIFFAARAFLLFRCTVRILSLRLEFDVGINNKIRVRKLVH